MNLSLSGTTLVPFQWVHSLTPVLVRSTPVVVGSVITVNFGTVYQFIQLHRGKPAINQAPLFSVPSPPNGGTTILDATHLGMTGIASDDLWIGLSLDMRFYTPVGTVNGSTQLMIR